MPFFKNEIPLDMEKLLETVRSALEKAQTFQDHSMTKLFMEAQQAPLVPTIFYAKEKLNLLPYQAEWLKSRAADRVLLRRPDISNSDLQVAKIISEAIKETAPRGPLFFVPPDRVAQHDRPRLFPIALAHLWGLPAMAPQPVNRAAVCDLGGYDADGSPIPCNVCHRCKRD